MVLSSFHDAKNKLFQGFNLLASFRHTFRFFSLTFFVFFLFMTVLKT